MSDQAGKSGWKEIVAAPISGAMSRLTPSDQTTLLILAATVAVVASGVIRGLDVTQSLRLHAGLLAGFGAMALFLTGRREAVWVRACRVAATMGVIFTLYSTLKVALDIMPWTGDAILARIDQWLFFGANPSLLAERHTTLARLEFFSFIYAFFIPYLYLSLFLGFVGRPAAESDELLTGFALTYAVSYLGYLFLPARGPVEFHVPEYAGALQGGFFHALVVSSTMATGGNHGAFPSLHVGAAACACLFDLRHNRLRGLTYVPVVILIGFATVYVRYHYVVDLLAGLGIAAAANHVAPRWLAAWRRRSDLGPPAAHGTPEGPNPHVTQREESTAGSGSIIIAVLRSTGTEIRERKQRLMERILWLYLDSPTLEM